MESNKIIELWEEGDLPGSKVELANMKDVLIQDIAFTEEWINETMNPVMVIGLNLHLAKLKTVLELITSLL